MKKILLAFVVLLCCASASRAKVESPEVPLGDAAYADLDLLSLPPEFECYPGWSTKPRIWTRYEFAIIVALKLDRLDVAERNGASKETETTNAGAPAVSKSQKLAAFQRLAKKFLPELTALGANLETGESIRTWRFNGVLVAPQIATPFADVPKDHWAFDAVEKLRLSGIIVGDADGS